MFINDLKINMGGKKKKGPREVLYGQGKKGLKVLWKKLKLKTLDHIEALTHISHKRANSKTANKGCFHNILFNDNKYSF